MEAEITGWGRLQRRSKLFIGDGEQRRKGRWQTGGLDLEEWMDKIRRLSASMARVTCAFLDDACWSWGAAIKQWMGGRKFVGEDLCEMGVRGKGGCCCYSVTKLE